MSATTVDGLLDVAERMTQSRGYNGVSFRDLAAAFGIKSASVHYHFPTKGQLGVALARRYTDRLLARLHEVETECSGPGDMLAAYVGVFRATLQEDGKMCLCGMLAAEVDTLPHEVRAEIARFVALNVDWLAGVLAKTAGKGRGPANVRRAGAIFAALQGAMLVARGSGDIAAFDVIIGEYKGSGLLDLTR